MSLATHKRNLMPDSSHDIRPQKLEILGLRSMNLTTRERKLKSEPNSSVEVSDCGVEQAAANATGSTGKIPSSDTKLCEFSCGKMSVMGRRRTMEDAITVAAPGWLSGEYNFFGVYDGHGGAVVAETCSTRMHKLLERHIEKVRKEDNRFVWEEVMVECFSSMDEHLREGVVEGQSKVGSTAVVVILGKDEVVVANCGDSRAVLCRGGGAVPLSSDHKPDRPDEKERIEAAGGMVVNWHGWRVQGILATSRSLGDHYLKPHVTSEPEMTVTRRTDADAFIIIATDGLWDVLSNEVACEVVKKCLNGELKKHPSDGSGASEAAATLAELAIAKGSKDNISVIVVQLL